MPHAPQTTEGSDHKPLAEDPAPLLLTPLARAWRDYGVQPWRSETFKFSTDPELVAKVTDVVGLYLAPPQNAVVLCVDELGRAGAHHCSEEQRVSPTRPPNPACASPRTGLSTD